MHCATSGPLSANRSGTFRRYSGYGPLLTCCVGSIVASRLDYCNALYFGMSSANFDKLQKVQNTLARIVMKQKKFDHITPSLIHLHWLPIRQRVTFKIATIAHKLLHTHRPAYLCDLVSDYLPVRQLRSSDQRLLTVSRTRTVLASRAFKHSAVEIWNNLPDDIRKCDSLYSFRSQLKTLFFRDAFAT
jgi:hypothetical protein